jgi:chitodextrinase
MVALALTGIAAAFAMSQKSSLPDTSKGGSAPQWISHPATLVAGSRVGFVLDPRTGSSCAVSAYSPAGEKQHLANAAANGAYLSFSFRIQHQAANGRWRMHADCLEALSLTRSASVYFRVLGGLGSGHASLAAPQSLSLAQLPVARVGAGHGPAGRGAGCDMGGNPFTDCDANPTTKWCTWWAYNQRPDIYNVSRANGAPPGGWDARNWANLAAEYGHFPEGTKPVVGAIAVFDPVLVGSQYGHVAYVEEVGNGVFWTSDHNWGGNPNTTHHNPHQLSRGITFIYGGPAGLGPLDQYNGHIVQWDGDPKQQKTAWLVTNGHRNWIPSSAIYNCLKSKGAPGPDVLPSSVLDQLPDQTGQWVPKCTNSLDSQVPTQPTVSTLQTITPPPLTTQQTLTTLTVTTASTTVTTASTSTATTATTTAKDTAAPSTPSGLSTSGATQISLALNWTASSDNVGVTGYKLFLNGSQVATTGSTSYTFSGLSCSTGYTLGVAAYDAAGNTSQMASAAGSTAGCPPPQYFETTGGVTHTWSNWTNAGGTEGPTISSNATVQIACRLTGWTAPDGNNWWYRIAQSPWNGQFYASADAFYNNGQTSGSLHGTPFVDSNLPVC